MQQTAEKYLTFSLAEGRRKRRPHEETASMTWFWKPGTPSLRETRAAFPAAGLNYNSTSAPTVSPSAFAFLSPLLGRKPSWNLSTPDHTVAIRNGGASPPPTQSHKRQRLLSTLVWRQEFGSSRTHEAECQVAS